MGDLYFMSAFTPAIWSTIAWTEKFNNGSCTHFLQLHGLKSSRNSSRLKNRRCELSLTPHPQKPTLNYGLLLPSTIKLYYYYSRWRLVSYKIPADFIKSSSILIKSLLSSQTSFTSDLCLLNNR